MSTRAKFTVQEVSRRKGWGKDAGFFYGIKMTPVTGGSEEDNSFFASTPAGSIEMSVVSEGAAEMFEPGKDYYVEFTPAN